MVAQAAGQFSSQTLAAQALDMAEIDISARHVNRIATAVGEELIDQRDKKVQQFKEKKLPVRVAEIPEVVAVEVDGGRLRTRATVVGKLGVHEVQNKEDKVACLVTLKSEVHKEDPQPELPPAFAEPRRVQRLVAQVKGSAGPQPQEKDEPPDTTQAADLPQVEEKERSSPERKIRTCVASMADSHDFAPMIAAEAQERGFYQAKRRAFVADGAKYNWWIQQAYFSSFVPITDYLHVVCYLYLGARAVSSEAEHWEQYLRWAQACWGGKVADVIAELQTWQERLGKPPEGEELDEKDPRRVVAVTLSYLGNNKDRMAYPCYRRDGLPVTSSLVESLVGEFNARVKSLQHYWNRPSGAEAILQLRAAVLSEDDRLERYFDNRPGNPHRRKAG